MSGHGQLSLPDTRSSYHRDAQEGKHARRRDTRWNQLRGARHAVSTRILLFARGPMRFSCTAKTRFYFTSDTDTSETMKSNTVSRALKTEVQGKEDWEGKKLGRGSFHSSRTYRLSRSLWDPRNTSRWKSERRTESSFVWFEHMPCISFAYLIPAPVMEVRLYEMFLNCHWGPVHNALEELFENGSLTLKTLHVSRPHDAEEIRKRKKNRPFCICG